MFRSSRVALSALFIALAAGLGFAGAALPNLELLSLTVFLGGAATGPWHGLFIGAAAELIFSGLNPLGLPFPLVFAAQLAGMGLVGLAGGLAGPPVARFRPGGRAVALGGLGFGLTLVFDVLTNLALGVHMGPVVPTLVGGLAFGLVHMGSNTLVFAGLGLGGLRVLGEVGALGRREGEG